MRQADLRRHQLREQLWPNSEERVWRGADEKGWWAAPRVLPLLLHLTRDKRLVGQKDCSAVYLELLSRDFGQGIVEIRDPDVHAYCAGYTSNRARRSWQERMRLLAEIGLIEIEGKGNSAFGYVLLLNPLAVAENLRREGRVDNEWWKLLQQQVLDSTGTLLEDRLDARGNRATQADLGNKKSP